jgi:hypothetical protein
VSAETPAAVLKRAADKLRALATADGITPGPWTQSWHGQDHLVHGPGEAWSNSVAEWTYAIVTQEPKVSVQRAECNTADAAFIATMHPGVGVALADWLESTAATVDAVTRQHADAAPADAHWLAPALAVARAVLGEGAQR